MRVVRALFAAFVMATPLLAVDGVVMNGSTSKPQAGVPVTLMQPGQNGMKALASTKTDANGTFKIDKDIPPGPAIVQVLYEGATYNSVITPGSPTSGLSIVVNDTTTDPASAKIAQHMILLEPSADHLNVNETFLLTNETTKTYNNADKGSAQVFLPREANATAEVTISAPGGMPIRRPIEATNQPGIFNVNYPVKPGETRFEVRYTLPKTGAFSTKTISTDGQLRLVTPGPVTLEGPEIEDLGQEPQTQAHIYNVKAKEFTAKINGTGSLSGASGEGAAKPADDSGAPEVVQSNARIYTRLPLVLGLTFALLLAGGIL